MMHYLIAGENNNRKRVVLEHHVFDVTAHAHDMLPHASLCYYYIKPSYLKAISLTWQSQKPKSLPEVACLASIGSRKRKGKCADRRCQGKKEGRLYIAQCHTGSGHHPCTNVGQDG